MTIWSGGICSYSQIRAQAKYDKKNTTMVSMKLNWHTDAEIIEWLRKQDSMQGSIKRLIREELDRMSKKQTSHPENEKR